MYEKISNSNPRGRAVIGINLETKETFEFTTIGQAGKWLLENGYIENKCAKSVINGCLKKTKKCYGFEWNLK